VANKGPFLVGMVLFYGKDLTCSVPAFCFFLYYTMKSLFSRKCGLLIALVFFLGEIVHSFGQCSAVVNTFPYQESFESGTANWTSGGTNNDWVWGSPTKAVISGAGAGTKCWIAGGSSNSFYNFGERSWVQSPCFDFTNVDKPYLSFLVFWDTEWRYDGTNIQYSLNGGTSWYTIGSANEPLGCNNENWYNSSGITNLNGLANSTSGWSGNTQVTSGSCQGGNGLGTWVRASHCVPQAANQPQVIFRFTFGSGTTCNDYDGFAFDDFYIGSPSVTSADFTFSCTGNSTLSFTTSSSNCLDTYQWDFGDPSSSSNTSTSQSDSHLFSSFGNFNVTLTTSGQCSADTTITKQVGILDATMIATDVTCQGDSDGSLSLVVLGSGPLTTIQWNTIPAQATPRISNLSIGEYTAVISDPVSCGLTLYSAVVEGPDSRPTVDLGNDLKICPGSAIPLIVRNYSSYLWQDGSTDSTFVVEKAGEVILNVTNYKGCETVDSLLVTEDCLDDLLFPNAFTPNQDGINELFTGIGSIPEKYSLRIYNRWGELIFESDNYLIGWDGKYKGHYAHDGVYVYQANFTVSNNTEIEKTGRVSLIR